MKVGHVGKQPTSLNGGLESVLQISMVTQITPGFSQKCHATSKCDVTNFDKYEFVLGEKMAHWALRPGISLFIFFPLGLENQSTHMYIK